MADEPRLGEAVQLYQDLGFQVHLEDVDPVACQQDAGCSACFETPEAAARFKVIFTRRVDDASSGEDENA